MNQYPNFKSAKLRMSNQILLTEQSLLALIAVRDTGGYF